ncbi:MAG: DUF2155 domain-containing protein [Nitrospirae bacterium]|nr:DUF2155 domain-containing protein [Nitrospirota bacterium]
MGKILSLIVSIAVVLSVVSCKKKEEPAPIAPATEGPGVMMPSQPMQIVVPDNVKGAWSSVKITIEDKPAKTLKDVIIKIGSEYKVPGSNLNIKVGAFLPDFKMEGAFITSASNQPNQPAVAVRVLDGDKQIFPEPGKDWGWLFSKLPAIHPFQHERFMLSLKEGIKG